MAGPVLFCYDGSSGSRRALHAAGDLITRPSDGFVLTAWQPFSLRMAGAEAFAPIVLYDEDRVDADEEMHATLVAEEGARLAREHGFDLSPRVERASGTVWQTILEVATELDMALVVCGRRGRGAMRRAVLGSVSHALLAHLGRPLLIAPEPSDPE
jgi:nucleotide-binding universal stress UspA family protein